MTAPLALRIRREEHTGPAGPVVEVGLRIPSDIAHIEAAVELLARHCLAGCRPSRRTAFRFRVVLAEALANAIICGNGSDAARMVAVRAECRAESLTVHVSDEGSGFDPASVPDPLGPEDLERANGRGLFLIRNLTDQLEFSPRGNALCMTFSLR